jgi:hypothetical protein
MRICSIQGKWDEPLTGKGLQAIKNRSCGIAVILAALPWVLLTSPVCCDSFSGVFPAGRFISRGFYSVGILCLTHFPAFRAGLGAKNGGQTTPLAL